MAASTSHENISTGIERIDEQHRMIVERLDFLREAVQTDQAGAVIGQMLTDLMEYAREHFVTEEEYFDRFHYPRAEEHREEHRKFIHDIGALYADFDAGKSVSAQEVLSYLERWIHHHLQQVDAAYVPFMKSVGAS